MTYCVTLKHGEVERHESMVDALLDLIECMDNPAGHGATIWWEEPDEDEPLWQYDVRTQTARGVEHREWLSAGEVQEFLAARFPEDVVDSTWQHLTDDGEVSTTAVGWGDLWVERYAETESPRMRLHPERDPTVG